MTPLDAELAPPGGWHPAGAPKIPLYDRSRANPAMRLVLKLAAKVAQQRTGLAKLPDVFMLLLRNRRLFLPWLRFASRLMPNGSLDRRDSELVILRAAWNCRSRYEWGQHVILGRKAGLTVADIARIAGGPDAQGWTPRQFALLRAADELHAQRLIGEQTWQLLAEHYAPAQLLEIAMLVGHYEMLAGVLNSVGLALEPEVEARLAAEMHR